MSVAFSVLIVRNWILESEIKNFADKWIKLTENVVKDAVEKLVTWEPY